MQVRDGYKKVHFPLQYAIAAVEFNVQNGLHERRDACFLHYSSKISYR